MLYEQAHCNLTNAELKPLLHNRLSAAKQTALPFRVDVHFGNKILFGKSGVIIRYKGIKVPVDPIILEHRVGRLCDTDVPTFNPRTLAHLSVLYGPMRPNDWKNILEYLRTIKDQVNVLPEEYFYSFSRIRRSTKNSISYVYISRYCSLALSLSYFIRQAYIIISNCFTDESC